MTTSLYRFAPAARTLGAPEGGTEPNRSHQRGVSNTVAKTVAQGQWRVRPSVAGARTCPWRFPMPMMAAAFPILPGKTPEWRAFMDELDGPRREEFVESRRRAGVRERTFLQSTPHGDVVIVTLEGDDPTEAFRQMIAATDEFATWFMERAKAVHGVDMSMLPPGSPSELVADTAEVPTPA